MMRIKLTAALLCGLFSVGFAQDSTITTTIPAPASGKKKYTKSVSEIIFSSSNVEAAGLDVSPIVRFTAFLHLGEQFHFDFSDKAGFYTGISLRNVGMITDLNDSVRVKQRVYTAGIPVALKFGNMQGTHLALGAEAEFAFNFKQKLFVNNEKSKTNEWFSNRTEIFLPSAFAEIHTKEGVYIKFKYYLTDFLVQDKQKINVTNVNFVPTRSQMFYVSIGAAINTKKYSKTYKPKTVGI
jgi:hypothetical protein